MVAHIASQDSLGVFHCLGFLNLILCCYIETFKESFTDPWLMTSKCIEHKFLHLCGTCGSGARWLVPYTHPCGWSSIPQARVLHQRPESLRFLCSLFAVPRTALFWTEISDVGPEVCHSPSWGGHCTEC